MLMRYLERRRYIRVPAAGPARWRSAGQCGHCEVVDISPGGAALRMPVRKATQLGPSLTLEVELTPARSWCLARDARVVRQAPDEDGTCVVGVAFAPQPWGP